MNYKKISLKMVILPLILLICMSFIPLTLIPIVNKTQDTKSVMAIAKSVPNEKRGSPHYDYIIGQDHLPHFRVFFWVPKNKTHFEPYADSGVITDVSEHGPVTNWSVVTTKQIKNNDKLVFIYVPKTFVILYGKGFQDVIHLKYN